MYGTSLLLAATLPIALAWALLVVANLIKHLAGADADGTGEFDRNLDA